MSDREEAIQPNGPAAGAQPAAGADTAAGQAFAAPAEEAPDRRATESTTGAPGDPDPAPPAGDSAQEPPASGAGEAGELSQAVAADLEELRARASQRDEYLALAQRAQADFDNYRKRMARETAQAMERGAGRLAKELLPALDHLELALKAGEDEGGELLKGVRMVQEEMMGALARVGIQPFSPTGERFDPNEHEAMVQRPAEGAEPGTVVEVYQQGYRINGTVLRPARVVVAA